MKILLSQIDTTIGDFAGNTRKILDGIQRAEQAGADLVVFPELALCGYPPRDLLEKPSFIERNLECVEEIARHTKHVGAVLGFVARNDTAKGRGLHNSAAIAHDGEIRFVQHKTLLPEYDVFDEARYFEPAMQHEVYTFKGMRLGLTLCEDLWSRHPFEGRRLYQDDPVKKLSEAGADIILNLSASPFTLGKQHTRYALASEEAKRYGRPLVYVNLVGGNDELVFDGRSFVVDAAGRVVLEAAAFEEGTLLADLSALPKTRVHTECLEEEEIERALMLGLRDYMSKCRFERCVIGLSGGIDSAVVAAIAARAVGPEKVTGVLMPSPYTQPLSNDLAEELARNLGIPTCTVPIGGIYEQYRLALGFENDGATVSLAEENIQARIRGMILMAISNRDGALVVSTGNKSEISVGYCTLYGDMAGGLALISDIPKTKVYALASYLNRDGEIIPEGILKRPPSAELRPKQTDQDSLPPYETLDRIIKLYVEGRMDVEAIVAGGEDRGTVERVARMIERNEYKRRQAAPGIKITSKAFGIGRRYPIAKKD